LRSFNLLSELSRRHAVAVATTHGPRDDPHELAQRLRCDRSVSVPFTAPKRGGAGFLAALARSWVSPHPVDIVKWRVPALRRAAAELIASFRPDVCVADFLTAVANLPIPASVPVVLFEHNVEHLIWKRLGDLETRPWLKALLAVEWRKMRRYEARACAAARMTAAVSEQDAALLRRLAPGARVEPIPTGVDVDHFRPNGWREAPSNVVFCGSMDWYPNEDAVLHFMDAVLPLVRREVPEASLTVVGRSPSGRLQHAAAAAGVHVTGTVGDVRPYVAAGAVFVVPLRAGGGTRLKIFEALAMSRAVVSTTVGAEGLPLVPGEHFLQADDPRDFARAVVSVLRDPGRRQALGAAGRRLVQERYSWPQVTRELEALFVEASRGG
jgi:glycosyltransferase involved in cell wall biosynthesis